MLKLLLFTIAVAVAACAPVLAGTEPDAPAERAPQARGESIDRVGETVVIEPGQTVGVVKVGGGTLMVRGRVTGGVQATASPVIVENGGAVEGGMLSVSGPVTVESGGSVEGAVKVQKADARVDGGGKIAGDLTVTGGNGTVCSGGIVEGRFNVYWGRREAQAGALVGGRLQQTQSVTGAGAGLAQFGALGFIFWVFGTIFGAGLAYAVGDLASERVEVVIEAWRARRGRVASWAISLVGLGIALKLSLCIGWMILVPLYLVSLAAGALGWTALLRMIGNRLARGRFSPAGATMLGFGVWAALGLVCVFPCFLPLALLVKWITLTLGVAAVYLSDWGRDPLAGGCWPVRGWR